MSELKQVFVWILLAAITVSCNDDDEQDLTSPEINVNSPKDEELFDAGSYIVFEALFSDDHALSTYSIDIHDVFDGHSHGRKSEDPELVKFSYRKNFDLPGETAHLVALPNEISIPDHTMAGPYDFIVQAIDAAGNATSYQDGSIVEVEILITNGSMAEIAVTNLVNGELEIRASSPFVVEGSVSDPPHPEMQGIEEVVFLLAKPDGEDDPDRGRKAEFLYEKVLEGPDLDAFYQQDGSLTLSGMIDFTLSEQGLSALLAEGTDHLELIIEVHDLQGNISMEFIPVPVHAD